MVAKHRAAEGVLMGLGQGEHLMGFSRHEWSTAGGSTAGWEWPPLHAPPGVSQVGRDESEFIFMHNSMEFVLTCVSVQGNRDGKLRR